MHNLTCAACGRALAETSAWKGSGERFYCNDFCVEADSGDLYQTAETLTHPRHRPRLSTASISHWTTVRFWNGRPGRAACSMSQGLRVLVLVLTAYLIRCDAMQKVRFWDS